MEHLWTIEERLWLEGVGVFKEFLHNDSVMILPEPVSILQKEGIMEGLRHAPRWTSIDMTRRLCLRPSAEVAILAYRAAAVREKCDPYHSTCSSTYVFNRKSWWLVHHQQSL